MWPAKYLALHTIKQTPGKGPRQGPPWLCKISHKTHVPCQDRQSSTLVCCHWAAYHPTCGSSSYMWLLAQMTGLRRV